jgi:2,4-dienoyl-CoA reductase-like NADH-dependent reductase (Old Yellow Enzyme family)
MSSATYSHLFQPIELGPMALTNRVIVPGHSMLLEDPNGIVGERYQAYLAERARGGAALVTGGSAPVHANSIQAYPHTWLWTDEVIDGLARAADGVHEAGARFSIILWHGGHNLNHLMGIVPRAPSPIPSPDSGEIPKAMTQADIDELIEAYAQAARRCSAAGLDAVEIQTSSNYLLGSFLSSRLNRRTDDYGGSLENRTRIVVQVLEAVRSQVRPGMAVGVRTSAEHLIPHDPEGYAVDDSLAAMGVLDDQGLVDWVSVMTGSHWCFEEMISPMNYPRAQIAHQAAEFKAKLQVPVIVAGRIRTPEEAEHIVAKGQADLVAMARPFIADPHWMRKVKAGAAAQIRPCMSCNQGCLGFAILGRAANHIRATTGGRGGRGPGGFGSRPGRRAARPPGHPV